MKLSRKEAKLIGDKPRLPQVKMTFHREKGYFMKKLLFILLSFVLVMCISGVSGATPITLTDTTIFTDTGTNASEDYLDHGRGTVRKLDGIFDYVAWQHNFTFEPAPEEIFSASLRIFLKDDEADTLSPFSWEIGGGVAESGDWDFGEINTGWTDSYSIDVDYLTDGMFQVVVASAGGDFYIGSSELSITYAPVPEPATMILMGLGLVGLAGASRKKLLKK